MSDDRESREKFILELQERLLRNGVGARFCYCHPRVATLIGPQLGGMQVIADADLHPDQLHLTADELKAPEQVICPTCGR